MIKSLSSTSINAAITSQQQQNILSIQKNIFDYLPDEALNELLGGYDNDIENLLYSTTATIHSIVNQDKISQVNVEFLPEFNKHFDESLRIGYYNYFKTVCLPEFDQYWRNIEWGNMVQLYDYVCVLASRTSGKSHEMSFALPLWKLYRYRKPVWGQPNNRENALNKRGVLVTNEFSLGKELLKKINDEIISNELIAEVLRPDRVSDLGKESISTKNGALLTLKSFGSSVRGLHPGWIVVDDFLDVSALYSSAQREKFKEIFFAEILPALEPNGKIAVVGTPFSSVDLYNDLKEDKRFVVTEYPAIFPDGRILASDRLTFKKLQEERESLGSIVFAREYLVTPISDSSTIFPWEYLNKAKDPKLSLVMDIESYGAKMDKVMIGCDFAISAGIGADSVVFTAWGAKYGDIDRYYLIGVWKKKGASHNEQVSNIISMDVRYRPNKIVAEDNGFQKILISLSQERGLNNIEPFTTTSGIKKDLYNGLPSLSALFERGQIIMPYGDENSRQVVDWLLNEFNGVTFLEDKGKLESAHGHDDGVMSSFFAITKLREDRSEFKISYV